MAKKKKRLKGMPSGTLQARMSAQGEMRAFNPQRDMVWCLPRLFKAALMELGVMDITKLRAIAKRHGLEAHTMTDDDLYAALKDVLAQIAGYFNALQNKPKNAEDIAPTLFAALYNQDSSGKNSIRAMVADLFMQRVFAELPFWLEQVRPQSRRDPVPDLDEIEDAVKKILDQLP